MVIELLSSLIETILLAIQKLGYLGIFVGMTIESSFFPLPSEIVLIPAGILIAQGKMNFFLVLLLSILGSVLGAWINYFLALFLGRTTVNFLIAKYGKFLFLTKKKLNKTDAYFKKHGEITTFIGRLIPLLRHLVSLPAGFAKMNFTRFTLFTALGAGIWSLILISTGMFFGSTANRFIKIISVIIVAFAAIIFLAYLYYKNRRKNRVVN